ncbi:hypothetical protein L6164_012604 [Bauhinia variegata]|uniref:Uncharacterized protein n=1 Tax=Bauhinia variegata TaxID=167791 RepID=A0ACB9PBR9_BAUVA|nr:hypothetical protein L6164_012604 [Bauhinia variegata]
MPIIRSLIQEMRSRSQRVVRDGSMEEVITDGMKHSCWANMPQELLREVLMRIEASEISWPPRKSVVVCAGVCRSWREITKEIVKTPELSAKITFPISVKQPGPREHLLQCFIKRNRSTQTYYLFLNLTNALADDGKFLLAARKCRRPTCTDYIISLNADDMSKGSNAYVGKLRSNFLGTKFTIYDGQPPHAGAKITKSRSTRMVNPKQVSPRVPTGNYPVAHISYELNVLGSRGPRRMHCTMDAIPASAIEPGGVAPTQTEFSYSNIDMFPSFPFFRSKSNRVENSLSGPLGDRKDGLKTFSWWLRHQKMHLLDQNTRRLSSNSEKLEKICLQWTTVTLSQHFRHLQSASATLIPRLLVNDASMNSYHPNNIADCDLKCHFGSGAVWFTLWEVLDETVGQAD